MTELMTLKEVASYLRLSVQTVYKMVEHGRIPALKAGARWRFRKDDVDDWMRTQSLESGGRTRTGGQIGVRDVEP